MPYEDLLSAVKAGADERIKEIRNRAQAEAEKILKDAEDRARVIRSASLEEAAQRVELDRSRLVSKAEAEKRMVLAGVKNDLFQQVFTGAAQRMASVRDHPRYRESFRAMVREAMEELGGEEVTLHIDPRDEALCREVLGEMKRNCDVVPDLTTLGGLKATTPDERLAVINTIESRLERAKELMKREVMSTLYAD